MLVTWGAQRPTVPQEGAVGIWYSDQYVSSPRAYVPNAITGVAASPNLLTAPRRLFNQNSFWAKTNVTAVDDAAADRSGNASEASTLSCTGAWSLRPAFSSNNLIPAGTYTLACWVKRNTGSDQPFAFTKDGTSTRSAVKTATSSWTRESYTFTIGAGAQASNFRLCSSDGATNAELLIYDLEMFSGSSDLGNETLAGHLYPGGTSAATQPTYASGAVDYSSSGFGLIQFPTARTINTSATAMALVSKVSAGSPTQGFLSKITAFATFTAYMESVSGRPTGNLGTNVAYNVAGLWTLLNKGYHTIATRYDGTTMSLWLDDILLFQSSAVVASYAIRDLYVAVVNGTSNDSGYKNAGMALWDRALSDSEMRQASAALFSRGARNGITRAATKIYCAEGDSITIGTGTTTYAFRIGANVSPSVLGWNRAVGGAVIADFVSRAAVWDQIIPPNKDGRTFIISVLAANDLLSSGTAQFLIDLAAWCDARRAAGWKVILCTILPRTTASFNTARNTANTTIRTWAGTHADAICDFAAEATMGPDAAASDTTYYSDGIHPTDAGQILLEPVMRAAVDAL